MMTEILFLGKFII